MKKPLIISLLFIVLMLFFGRIQFTQVGQATDQDTLEVKALVLSTNDSKIVQTGISRIGSQLLLIEILEGSFKGQKITADNGLLGKLELDNYYKPGDKVIAALLVKDNKILAAKAIDLYRQDWQIVLFALFVLCLICYAGIIGIKSLLSFIASLFIIWELLIPGLLSGKHPLLLTTLILTLLTAIIIFAVAGFTKKGLAAFAGTMGGLLLTVLITQFFGDKLALGGMTQPYAETLLYSGHLDLNMKLVFYSAIILGASGAAMDIAMDVAAAMEEIKIKKPDIGMKELIQSGFNVGRAVIGTMTTTLLLAYSGGYLSLLMLFMSKNSSLVRMINLKIVSAEIMRTVVGSIGLVLVAPLTAIIAGWIYSSQFNLRVTGKADSSGSPETLAEEG